MNKKNVIISAIKSGLSLSKRFLCYLTMGLRFLLIVLILKVVIVGCLTHMAQSLFYPLSQSCDKGYYNKGKIMPNIIYN